VQPCKYHLEAALARVHELLQFPGLGEIFAAVALKETVGFIQQQQYPLSLVCTQECVDGTDDFLLMLNPGFSPARRCIGFTAEQAAGLELFMQYIPDIRRRASDPESFGP